MTHKSFLVPEGEIYVPMHVGRELGMDLGYLGDNTGDNISDLNPYFGELTGIYWIWKNDVDSDYIGVCHYRRFFVKENGDIFQKEDFEKVLSEHDCMTSDVVQYKTKNYDSYKEAHNIEHLMAVKDSCKRLYPEYKDSFEAFLEDNSLCYGNICVMPRDMFMSYCTWMFSILFDASENIDVSDCDLYQKRVYGFLSERLLNVYVRHNKFNVGETFVGAKDEKAETKELRLAIKLLISRHQIEEARKLFLDITYIRPDVALPMSDVLHSVPLMDHITYIMHLEKRYGKENLINYSDDLTELFDYYKKAHALLEGLLDNEGQEYLVSTGFSPVAAAVMISQDIGKVIKQEPLDKRQFENNLKMIFKDEDLKIYKQLVKK